jgi:CDP-diacylglycerol--glycerol-3-phosphate 3-phosphatidyltransferase
MTGVPPGLRRRWRLTVLSAVLATGVVVFAATHAFAAMVAAMWLAAAAVPIAYTQWVLGRSLDLNHPPEPAGSSGDPGPAADVATDGGTVTVGGRATDGDSQLYSTLGVANGLTLTRGWLYAGVAGFLLVVPPADSAWRWLPALWYGVGVAFDWLDGTVARTVSRPTVLGERLDHAFDTLGFLVAPLVGVVWGALPVWYLAISAARYLFLLGCWLREARGLPVDPLPESRVRRPLAAFQMAVITVALVPATPAALVHPAVTVAMLPSLAVFLRDYLAVTGRLDGPVGHEAAGRSGDRP